MTLEATALDYEVVFEGLSEGNTKDILLQISETQRLIDQPPDNYQPFAAPGREDDIPRLLQGLRARGHYQAAVEVDIDQTASPITITYRFDRGPTLPVQDYQGRARS